MTKVISLSLMRRASLFGRVCSTEIINRITLGASFYWNESRDPSEWPIIDGAIYVQPLTTSPTSSLTTPSPTTAHPTSKPATAPKSSPLTTQSLVEESEGDGPLKSLPTCHAENGSE